MTLVSKRSKPLDQQLFEYVAVGEHIMLDEALVDRHVYDPLRQRTTFFFGDLLLNVPNEWCEYSGRLGSPIQLHIHFKNGDFIKQMKNVDKEPEIKAPNPGELWSLLFNKE